MFSEDFMRDFFGLRRGGAKVNSGTNVVRSETATWVRWTEDGRLQQRWWVVEETPTSRKQYEDWRDVPTLKTSSS